MGTWGINVKSNDDFLDIYEDIMKQFNNGISFDVIIKEFLNMYEKEYKDELYQLHNLYFALAYSCWECGYYDKAIFEKVKKIIDDGSDIEAWRELGAEKSDLKKREKALSDFFLKISKSNEKPKKPKAIKFKPAIFEKGTALAIEMDDGKYSGAIVLENTNENDEFGVNLILKAYLSKETKPTIEDILKAKVYDFSWYSSLGYKKFNNRFDIIGKIVINQVYGCGGIGTSYSGWITLVSTNDDNYYKIKEYSDVKNIDKFLRIKADKIKKRQKQSVLNSLRK